LPIGVCLASHTHRQYNAWQEYLDQEWNEPNRTDHYLMQVAELVLRPYLEKGVRVKLDDFKIPFRLRRGATPVNRDEVIQSKKRLAEISEHTWIGAVAGGGPIRVQYRWPDGSIHAEPPPGGKKFGER
jgi:hypothetical protein